MSLDALGVCASYFLIKDIIVSYDAWLFCVNKSSPSKIMY